MLEHTIEMACAEFIKAVKETSVYRDYHEQLRRLKEQPDCYEKVNEFRLRNYEIQNSNSSEELFDRMDAFEKEYEKFRENPLVDAFLHAELAFCRMLQEVSIQITRELDFQ